MKNMFTSPKQRTYALYVVKMIHHISYFYNAFLKYYPLHQA